MGISRRGRRIPHKQWQLKRKEVRSAESGERVRSTGRALHQSDGGERDRHRQRGRDTDRQNQSDERIAISAQRSRTLKTISSKQDGEGITRSESFVLENGELVVKVRRWRRRNAWNGSQGANGGKELTEEEELSLKRHDTDVDRVTEPKQ